MIKRLLQEVLVERLSDHKAIILLGPRRVGKSTLYQILEKQFTTFECKWNKKAKGKMTRVFGVNYPEASLNMVYSDNVQEYLL